MPTKAAKPIAEQTKPTKPAKPAKPAAHPAKPTTASAPPPQGRAATPVAVEAEAGVVAGAVEAGATVQLKRTADKRSWASQVAVL